MCQLFGEEEEDIGYDVTALSSRGGTLMSNASDVISDHHHILKEEEDCV